jgi:alkanesulfonate monooxygenase SsuD/methylene tetrahydromethanopterin reductase-like flavin-dependent oxidoreductase (luciferase family)
MTDPETLSSEIVCGNDPEKHIDEIKRFIDAGYDHVFVHQLGPQQKGFIDFYKDEVLPEFQ